MAGTGLPIRPPSVCALLPQELSYQTVEVDKIYIPTNALLIAENELIFLAIASILKDLKAVLIGEAGYVYFGRINSRLVFLLKARGEPFAVIQAIKSLKPKAGIFLGFGKCPHSRPYEIGDVIVSEAIARKNPKLGKLESLACSECLINVFENANQSMDGNRPSTASKLSMLAKYFRWEISQRMRELLR